MKLPSIPVPRFDITLPSSGKVVSARPFLVSEQKIILYAVEIKAEDQIFNAIDDVLDNCLFGKVDIDTLPLYDVEHIMLQIRARSVSEKININYICNHIIEDKVVNAEVIKHHPDAEPILGKGPCDERIPLTVDISRVLCAIPEERESSPTIMFSETIGVQMRDMKYREYKQIRSIKDASTRALSTIAACVDTVIDGEDLHTHTDFSQDEMVAWLGELTNQDFRALKEYALNLPTLESHHQLTCPSCGHGGEVHLKGLNDFLK